MNTTNKHPQEDPQQNIQASSQMYYSKFFKIFGGNTIHLSSPNHKRVSPLTNVQLYTDITTQLNIGTKGVSREYHYLLLEIWELFKKEM